MCCGPGLGTTAHSTPSLAWLESTPGCPLDLLCDLGLITSIYTPSPCFQASSEQDSSQVRINSAAARLKSTGILSQLLKTVPELVGTI